MGNFPWTDNPVMCNRTLREYHRCFWVCLLPYVRLWIKYISYFDIKCSLFSIVVSKVNQFNEGSCIALCVTLIQFKNMEAEEKPLLLWLFLLAIRSGEHRCRQATNSSQTCQFKLWIPGAVNGQFIGCSPGATETSPAYLGSRLNSTEAKVLINYLFQCVITGGHCLCLNMELIGSRFPTRAEDRPNSPMWDSTVLPDWGMPGSRLTGFHAHTS